MQLIDEYLPEYDAREIHRIQVHAPPSRIYWAIRSTDLADAKSRRYFGLYWAVIRPGSGLIRRCMLRSIRKKAEGAT